MRSWMRISRLSSEDRFDNEITKSRVLMALDRKDEAAAAHTKALDLASPIQVHTYARQLLGEKHTEEAIAIFTENAKKHPDLWFVHAGMARAYCAQGKFEEAARVMKQAQAGAPENQKQSIDVMVKRLEAREDINHWQTCPCRNKS